VANIKVIERGIVYENSLPQLRSRHGYFPNMAVADDGIIVAAFLIGEAFESVDLAPYISTSSDGGKTWTSPTRMSYEIDKDTPITDSIKVTYAGGGRLLAFGYRYRRDNPDLPIGNPETGGVLDSKIIFTESPDMGKTWSKPKIINRSFSEPVEASAPITILKKGSWVSPIANFFNWEGKCPSGLHGRLIRSDDQGKTWDDSAITMEFESREVAIWEQRLCELENGKLLVIAWNENLVTGERLSNHYVISEDGGRSFSKPASTGIMGQASSVLNIGNNKVLALHCLRRDTNRPGIYGYIVDLANGNWDIICEEIIWEPDMPVKSDGNMAAVFSFLKFGQTSAIDLEDGNYLVTNWVTEDGRGKIAWHRIEIK